MTVCYLSIPELLQQERSYAILNLPSPMDTKDPAPDVDKTIPQASPESINTAQSEISSPSSTELTHKKSFFSPEEKMLLFGSKIPHSHSSPTRAMLLVIVIVGIAALFLTVPNTFNRTILGEKFSLRSVLGIDKIYSPLASELNSYSLDISTPENNTVVFNKSLTVQGTTLPQSTVLISTNGDHWGTQSDTIGNFTQTISLTPGLNTITIDTFDSNGTDKQDTLTIYYSEESL